MGSYHKFGSFGPAFDVTFKLVDTTVKFLLLILITTVYRIFVLRVGLGPSTHTRGDTPHP